MKSAPVAIPARRASQPQCRPMTSMTNAREWDEAVEEMESIDSQIRCSAVKAPMVRSVIDMSLLSLAPSHMRREGTYSIEPTRPTMLRCWYASFCSSLIRPEFQLGILSSHQEGIPVSCSSLTSEGHSPRSLSAPVRDPSPPQTAKQSIPNEIRFWAACNLPSLSRTTSQPFTDTRV